MLPHLASVLARIADLERNLSGLDPTVTATSASAATPPASFAATLAAATGANPVTTRVSVSGRAGQFDDLVQAAAQRYGVDPDLVHAVIQVESDYNPDCTSSAGAVGLMQLMPGTAAGLGVGDARDPSQNIAGGVRYLRGQLDRFHDVDLALAAYNAGPGAVTRHGGVPPYRETQAYVRRVMQVLWQRKGEAQ